MQHCDKQNIKNIESLLRSDKMKELAINNGVTLSVNTSYHTTDYATTHLIVEPINPESNIANFMMDIKSSLVDKIGIPISYRYNSPTVRSLVISYNADSLSKIKGEQVKKRDEQGDFDSIAVKEGVDNIFEENPELANEVYEALGFKTESSSNTITRDIKEELPFKVIGNYNEIDEGLIGRKFYEEKIGNDLYRFEISNYSYPNEDGSSESFYDIDFTVNGSEEVIGTGFFDKAERAKQILQALLSQNFGNDTVRFNVEESKKGKQRLSLYKRLMNQLGYNPSGEMEYALFYNTNTFLSPSDKIVFGHPTIGKSYLKQKGNNEFITLDDDYADEVNAFVDANRGSETRQEYKGRKPKEYNQFMLNLFDRLKIQAQKEGKKLFVSNTNILKERMSDFDKVITMPKDEFKKRFDARGATYGFEDWKSDIDATVAKVPINKIINTTGYLSDLFKPSNEIGKINLTPQQKQQAQQLYSQYLDTIFPDYIDNFAYEAVEELLVANKIIDRKC